MQCNAEFCSCKATLYTCSEKLYACTLSPLLGGCTMPLPLPPLLSRVMNEAEEMGRGLLCWGWGGNHIRDFSTLAFFCSPKIPSVSQTIPSVNPAFPCTEESKLLSAFFLLRVGWGRGAIPLIPLKKTSYFWPKKIILALFGPFLRKFFGRKSFCQKKLLRV